MTETQYVQIQAQAQIRILMEVLTRIQVDMIDVIDQEEYQKVRKTVSSWQLAVNIEIGKIKLTETKPTEST